MHRKGSPSWQFRHGDMGYLHTALLVRDAAGLPVAPSAEIPPPLAVEVPDCADILGPAERVAAGRQWVVWWHRLADQAVREARQSVTTLPAGIDPDDFNARIRHRFAGREDVFDPPAFASLSGMEPLRSAVTATFGLARVQPEHRPGSAEEEPERFPWPTVNEAVQSSAAELGILVSELAGYANVLEVEGLWSYVAGPGCALCSEAVACDPTLAARLLREIFRSGLRAA
jgi:hypothetical protein